MTTSWRRYVGVLALAMYVASGGCREKQSPVDYDAPEVKPAVEIDVGSRRPVEDRGALQTSSLVQTVKSAEPMRIFGVIENSSGGRYGKVVLIRVLGKSSSGQQVVAAAGNGRGRFASDDKCEYDVIIPAPSRRGTYELEIACVDGNSHKKGFVALGKLIVR